MTRVTGSTDAASGSIRFDHIRQAIRPTATALTSPKSENSSPAENHRDWVGGASSAAIGWLGAAPGADVDAGGSMPAPFSLAGGVAGGSGSAVAGGAAGASGKPGRAISGQGLSFGPIARNVSPSPKSWNG